MKFLTLIMISCLGLLTGCSFNLLNFDTGRKPLTECVLSGSDYAKIAVINIDGVISEDGVSSMLGTGPSMLEGFVAELQIAEQDDAVRGVVLRINSPGGTVVASELIYKEIVKFKQKTQKPVVVSMVGMAASGGYYVSLPADYICATPATITGSIGVIMMYPNLSKLMDLVGVKMEIYKSGENKDIISIFKDPSTSDKQILQEMIMESAEDFWGLVKTHRNLNDSAMIEVKTARIFSARQAKANGLIDEIGYTEDAIAQAIYLAKVSENSRVVTYRRNRYPNDNIYNKRGSQEAVIDPKLIDLGSLESSLNMKPGMYMLWIPMGQK